MTSNEERSAMHEHHGEDVQLRPRRSAALPIRHFAHAAWRSPLLAGLVRVVVAVLLLVQAAHLVFQPDMRDEVRRADREFLAGHYYMALQQYAELSARYDTAELALRVGIVRTVRGEYDLAEQALWHALDLGLQGDRHDLAALYQGYVLMRRDRSQRALTMWRQISATSSLDGARRLVRAEEALHQGDYAAAEVDYRAVAAVRLPVQWRALASYRLALLRAANDPDAALADLKTAVSARHSGAVLAQPWPDPFVTPLLPDADAAARHLQSVLQADAAIRPQLLGQFYLDLNLFNLAQAQFALVAADSPNARAAAAYAAYTRWQAGDRQGGLEQLEAMVEAYPDDTRARTLLALVYLAQQDNLAARTQIDTIAAVAPTDPDTHLAWANWYTAQRDYVRASNEYQRALRQAGPEQRGDYALLVARFHLNTTYALCDQGLPAAQAAVEAMPESADAWTVLAAGRYYCGDAVGAINAARVALSYDAEADAAFYLGIALSNLGNHPAAQAALVQAADMAPASVWRQRAEARLVQILAQ